MTQIDLEDGGFDHVFMFVDGSVGVFGYGDQCGCFHSISDGC